MLTDMTGSRYDGQAWPGFRGLIDVPGWEAVQLIANRNAEYPDAPELARGYGVLHNPDLDYEAKLKLADGSDQETEEPVAGTEEILSSDGHRDPRATGTADDYDDDFDRDDDDNEVEDVKKPYTSASKADWIHYAISQGESRGTAVEMTKAALIEKYNS